MSIYDWPSLADPGEREDDPYARLGFASRRRRALDLDDALLAGRAMAPQGSRRARDRARRAGVPFAPPNGLLNLWVPLGPGAAMLAGQAANRPRVSGRVVSLAVHPDGERVYAAAGNGGIWYTKDSGASWKSIGGFAATDTTGITRPAHRNACGAIFVKFDSDESKDVVFVGTGETTPWTHARAGSALGGVGIFVATGPASSSADDPWVREAPNLVDEGVYRIAAQPGGNTIVAATSVGLFERPSSPGAGVPWAKVSSPPFNDLTAVCSDAIWTAGDGTRPARLWVWVVSGKPGLWVRADGDASFTHVTTSGSREERGGLAAAEPPTKVYVLNNRNATSETPALYRVDASSASTPTAEQVTDGVPDVLRTQGNYDLAIAVDPGNADRVAIAGAYIAAMNPHGDSYEDYNASIVVADIGTKDSKLTFGATAAPTVVGIGAHPDVHDLRYAKNGDRLWTGCDGGVFRSDHPTKQVGFIACNDGFSIAEANFVASHPTCEGRVVVGLQDNGVIERLSTDVWQLIDEGDGGGVAFDPVDTTRHLAQYIRATWSSSSGNGISSMLVRGTELVGKKKEDGRSAFYSSPGLIKDTRASGDVTQVLIGTDRLWYTEDWGANWVTLPTATDPISATTYNPSQDQFDETITVCRWATPDVAWVLTEQQWEKPGGQLYRFQRRPGTAASGGPGAWVTPVVRLLAQSGKAKKGEAAVEGTIRQAIAWTDIAVDLQGDGSQRGASGSIYLGTAGHPTNADVDTLWWFDGDSTWHPTGLRSEAVAAPVTAILCDRANPDHVYVGTTVGVWRGTRTLADGQPPDWVWEALVNGLPEAAVEDLALFDSGGIRLLRAAISARGVWELELDAMLTELTYVRAHNDDLRRRTRALELQRDGKTSRSWHGSPDVRPRPAPAAIAEPTSLPWQRTTPAVKTESETLLRFQAALRSQKNDPRSRPTGVWDLYFEEVLRDNGAPEDGSKVVSIDSTFWQSVMVAPHSTAEPWGSGTPLEADLYEFAPKLDEGDADLASCTTPRAALKVDVVVHRRAIAALDGADVRVTLLRWADPASPTTADPDHASTWFSGNVPWTAAVNETLNSTDGATSQTFAGGWSFVGSAPNLRQTLTGQRLDNMRSGIATFDLDLSTASPNAVVLLVAVIRADGDIALAPAPLRDLALNNPTVAVRSIRLAT